MPSLALLTSLDPVGPRPLDRVLAAQRALLAPAAFGGGLDADEWAASVTEAVRSVAGCDHTLFVMPVGAADGPADGPAIHVYSDDTDASVPAAVEAAFDGPWGDDPTWADALLGAAYQTRRRGGPGAYHERDLAPASAVEASAVFREALAPNGLRHTLGIAVPLADGREFSVAAYYERADAPGFTDETLADLALLVPALDAGARAYLRYGPEATARRAGFTAAVDALSAAVLVLDETGAEVHWNGSLVGLLEPETEDGRLLAHVRRWARYLGTPSRTTPPQAVVQGVHGRYRLGGVRLEAALDGVGGVVTVERVGLPLPPAPALRDRFGLTRRETEVASLLAEGLSDRTIAACLSIAHATARRHTERVLRKLGVSSRAAVAACLCQTGVRRYG